MGKSHTSKLLGIDNNSKVLFIYPHPDDETYCNAGLIQRLQKKGVQLRVVCLTKGEASTLNFTLDQNTGLADTRQKEFESVMKYLGASSYSIGNLGDSKLASEEEKVNAAVSNEIYNYKPNYIITYEPSGIYGHPDHILVSRVVTELCRANKIKVIYSTVAKGYKSAASSLKMSNDSSNVLPIAPNFKLGLNFREYIKKINCFKLYKSQISLKQEPLHKLYQAFKIINEYYYVEQ